MDEAFQRIFKEHKKLLPFIKHPNPKVLICFSGVPGAGKTTTAKALEANFHGMRLSSKEVNEIIDRLWMKIVDPQRRKLIQDYTVWLMDKIALEFVNKLISLDSSIDNKYPRIFAWADENSFQKGIICLRVPKETAIERVRLREEKYDDYIKNMNRWQENQNKFLESTTPDIYFDVCDNFNVLYEFVHQIIVSQ